MKQETPLKLVYLKPLFFDLYSAKRSHTERNYSQDSSINVCACVCVLHTRRTNIPRLVMMWQHFIW